jgi:pSer/pThr/pTyr-binding forkhead associated (FHA) protein
MLDIHIEYPDGKTQDISLQTGVYQIGRTTTGNDIVINHDTISRVHAEISVTKHHLRIKDLHSSSGTLLNGKSCNFEQKMQDGDNLLLGMISITIKARQQHNTATMEDEKTRAFHKEELSTVLQDLHTENTKNTAGSNNSKKIIIGLCSLIAGLCIYIFMSR